MSDTKALTSKGSHRHHTCHTKLYSATPSCLAVHLQMREHLFPASGTTLGLMCGPPGLLDNVCVPGLTAMGYSKEQQVLF